VKLDVNGKGLGGVSQQLSLAIAETNAHHVLLNLQPTGGSSWVARAGR
jgi:hypothetical protein